MPTLVLVTELAAPVGRVLGVSLDLDVEVVAGRRHLVHPVYDGPGSRTSGQIDEGERVRWAARLWGLVPMRHTSVIVQVVRDDGRGGASFTDVMVSGAFDSFRHEHELVPLPGRAVRMTDHVSWVSPWGPLGRLADAVVVRRMMAGLLTARNAEIARRVLDG